MDTPYFLYDGDMIADRCYELRDAFAAQNVRLFYAVKANDHSACHISILGGF
jgi:diaminopimelate decarboxylase